jgi:hypothetical protein
MELRVMSMTQFCRSLSSLCNCTAPVFVLAGFGALFLFCGGNTVWRQGQPPKALPTPTPMTLEELEDLPELPNATSVDLRQGYLFWPGAQVIVQIGKLHVFGVPVEGSRSLKAVYVPLLSKAALDRWRNLLGQRGMSVRDLPYHECRVLVELSMADVDKQFPDMAPAIREGEPRDRAIDPPQSFQGSVGLLANVQMSILKSIDDMKLNLATERTFVLRQHVDNSKANTIFGWCLCAVSVLCLVPLGVWAWRRWA